MRVKSTIVSSRRQVQLCVVPATVSNTRALAVVLVGLLSVL